MIGGALPSPHWCSCSTAVHRPLEPMAYARPHYLTNEGISESRSRLGRLCSDLRLFGSFMERTRHGQLFIDFALTSPATPRAVREGFPA